jgi:hypothetical protein
MWRFGDVEIWRLEIWRFGDWRLDLPAESDAKAHAEANHTWADAELLGSVGSWVGLNIARS